MKDVVIASLERCIAEINVNAEQKIAIVKERLLQEKIIPYNQEVDSERVKAEQALAQNLDKDIRLRQEQYNKDRQTLLDAAQSKKDEYAKSVIASATYEITKERDKAVTKLQSQINTYKE